MDPQPRTFQNSGDFQGAAAFLGSRVNNTGQIAGTINNYSGVVPASVRAEELGAAERQLEGLPTDRVPDPAPLPEHSWMRVPRNPLFVGRLDDLLWLARSTKAGEVAAVGQIAAATGLGGIGKTQLAAEFVHRYGQFFAGGVFWLSFAEAANVPGEIARCGGSGGLALHSDFASLPEPQQLALVLAAWCSALPRLLVFDNCEDPALLVQWRPPHGGCRILLTSRRQDWPRSLGVQPHALGTLAPAESVALLHKHRPDLRNEDPDLAAIATELGHLPLALHLAGSYLERYRYGPEGRPPAYLAALGGQGMLDHASMLTGDPSPTGHELHVANTFALSWRKLDDQDSVDATARALLFRAACFAPGEPIPRDLLEASLAAEPGGGIATLATDALHRAASLGLIEQRESGALVLHRLLAAFLQRQAGDALGAAREAVEDTVLDEASRLNGAGYPAPLTLWRAQLHFVAQAAAERSAPHAASLQNELGYHLRMVAEFPAARAAFERALAIDEKTRGPGHPNVATDVNNLGIVLHDLGDLAGARAAFERALAIDEKTLGPDHPNVAIRVNNLGLVFKDLGDLAGARAAFERALAIDEKTYGSEHPNVARDASNLGLVLKDLGDLAGARAAYQRAQAIGEKTLGPDHPSVATYVNNLGGVLHDLGDPAGACAAFERALAIDEKALGPEHPSVARDVNNLGSVLEGLGDLAGARAAFERALAIGEKTLGPDHPHVAIRMNNLGNVLRALGDAAGARAAFERALAIDEKTYGSVHTEVATDVNNLGRILHDLGDLAGARAAFERALVIDEKTYGSEHPKVAILVNNLGGVLLALGDLAGARAAFERALATDEKTYGSEHPNVAAYANNLGGVLRDLGDLAGARAAFERALAISEEALGPEHPNIAAYANNLGGVLRDLGDLAGARAAFERVRNNLGQLGGE